MKISLSEAHEWFAETVYWHAYHFNKDFAEDAAHDLFLALVRQEWKHEPMICRATGKLRPINPSHVNHLLKQRAIDLNRRRQTKILRAQEIHDRIPAPGDVMHAHDELDRLLSVLAQGLTPLEFEIVRLRAFPDLAVQRAASRDRKAAEADRAAGALRMFTSGETRVFDRHVAEVVGVSLATVSRATTHARQVLAEALNDD